MKNKNSCQNIYIDILLHTTCAQMQKLPNMSTTVHETHTQTKRERGGGVEKEREREERERERERMKVRERERMIKRNTNNMKSF